MVALVRYDTMNNQLQSVLQDNLTSTGHIADCAIFKRKDVALRASSSGFMVNTLFWMRKIHWQKIRKQASRAQRSKYF